MFSQASVILFTGVGGWVSLFPYPFWGIPGTRPLLGGGEAGYACYQEVGMSRGWGWVCPGGGY